MKYVFRYRIIISDIVEEESAGTNTEEDTTIGIELDQDEDWIGEVKRLRSF